MSLLQPKPQGHAVKTGLKSGTHKPSKTDSVRECRHTSFLCYCSLCRLVKIIGVKRGSLLSGALTHSVDLLKTPWTHTMLVFFKGNKISAWMDVCVLWPAQKSPTTSSNVAVWWAALWCSTHPSDISLHVQGVGVKLSISRNTTFQNKACWRTLNILWHMWHLDC